VRQALFYFSQWIALLCLKHKSINKALGCRPPQALRLGWFTFTSIVKERGLEMKKSPKERGLAVLVPSTSSHMLSQTTFLG